jgi:osmoprotectant transport system permease protein
VDEKTCSGGYLMDFVGSVWSWLTDSAHWSGPDGIVLRATEHVQISFSAVLVAMLVAVPIGLYVGHTRRFELFAITTGNLGRALPSFGILAICFGIPFFAQLPGVIGYWPTFAALFLLAVPPILINTYVGIKGVDPDVVEAARGMGMTGGEILRRIELPLAIPLMLSGLRIASVQVVATATLGALGGYGTFGRYIIDGRSVGDNVKVAAGAVLVALLALVVELGLGALERVAAPRTMRAPKRRFAVGRLGGEPETVT